MLTKQEFDEWIAALRSGNYPKGRGRLLRCEGDDMYHYCCLGVLSHLNRRGVTENAWRFACISLTGIEHSLPHPEIDGGILSKLPIQAGAELAEINDGSPTFEPVIEYLLTHQHVIVGESC